MVTNIDRLHAVVEGKLCGRGSGKTYARCHELAGYIETGYKNIICLITNADDCHYLLPMIKTVMEEHRIEITKITSTKFKAGDSTVHLKRYDSRLEGLYGVVVPLGHWD